MSKNQHTGAIITGKTNKMVQESNTKKVVKGLSAQTIVTIMSGLVSIVSFSVMSRLLTKEDFGFYAAITAITVIFSSFTETGIGAALIQRKTLDKRYIDNAFTINLLFALFISILLIVLSAPLSKAIIDESVKKPLQLMAIPLFCHCLTSINYSMMKRQMKFLRVGIISVTSSLLGLACAVVLALKGFGYYTIIYQSVISAVVMVSLSFFLCDTKYGFALDKTNFKSIFSFSGWLMASVVFRNIAQQIDRLIMPRLISVQTLGEYVRPKEFIGQISTRMNEIFDTVLFPVLSGFQDEKERLASAFERSYYYMNIFSMLLTIAVVFNGELIIRIFFGADWLYLRNLTMIVSCSLLFNSIGRLADCYMRSMGMTKQQFYFRVVETIVATISVIVGYRWGVMGVAVLVMLSNSLIKIIKVVYVSNKIGIKLKELLEQLFSSWKFSLFVIPPTLTVFILTPNTLLGNLILLVTFIVVSSIIFIAFPGAVGKQYKNDAYVQVRSFIVNRFKLLHKRAN